MRSYGQGLTLALSLRGVVSASAALLLAGCSGGRQPSSTGTNGGIGQAGSGATTTAGSGGGDSQRSSFNAAPSPTSSGTGGMRSTTGGSGGAIEAGGGSGVGRAGMGDQEMGGASGSSVAGSGGGVSDAGAPGGDAGAAVAGASGAGAAGGPGAASTQDCAGKMVMPGDSMQTLMHDNTQRQYIRHVPASYDGQEPVPLVLDFHGWTSNAMQEEMDSGWKNKSDSVGFIAVFPIGLDASWNGGALCCGTSQASGVDDEGFAIDIVKQLQQDACIDSKRVYVTGISNGGAMSHLLACKEASTFAAAAPVSMGNGTTPCKPSRPISVVMFRGMMDVLVPYNGGAFPSAQADFDMWKNINNCMGSPMMTHTYCQTYTQCDAGTEVTLCSLPNAGHIVYDDTTEISVADVGWEAFERQTLP